MVKIPSPKFLESKTTRTVWCLPKADWNSLDAALQGFDWRDLGKGTAEDALNCFLEVLWFYLVKYIPQIRVETRKGIHPWLNDRCRAAIRAKNKAEGTERYAEARLECINILQAAHGQYVEEIKKKLVQLPRRSR